MSLTPSLYKKILISRKEQLEKELIGDERFVEWKQLGAELERLCGTDGGAIRFRFANEENNEMITELAELDGGTSERASSTKDLSNSPGAKVKHGHRIEHIYNMVDDLVLENGGKANILDIRDHLVEVEGMSWEDSGVKNSTGRISSYILLYNKANPDDQRLGLIKGWHEGKEARGKMPYKEIIRVNNVK